MLTAPRSAKLLARLLADPGSFTGRDEELVKELQAGAMDTRSTAEQWTALSNSIRFYMGVAYCSRLSSAPAQTLKVAMTFEACRSVYSGSVSLEIQRLTLELAIEHVEECLSASNRLEAIVRRVHIDNDAEWLLARIRSDFFANVKDGAIVLSRTDITSRYAHHPGRGGLGVRDLYGKLIHHLIARGLAKPLPKDGKLERYAFRADG
jgi:hypothetical protein